MKFIKYSALLIGSVAMLTGLNACDKDDDDSPECCTVTYEGYYGYDTKVKACSDGTYKVTYDGETVYSGNWEDEYSWKEVKAMILEEGGSCK